MTAATVDPAALTVRRATVATVARLLDELGADAGSVADTLRAAGARGRPRAGDRCPVANWLRDQTGYDVTVGNVGCRIEVGRAVSVVVDLPPAVELFVQAFDRGRFNTLVKW